MSPWPEADISSKRFRWSPPPLPMSELPDVDGLLAGAAEVDITPPPGMPKAGHSKNAHDGNGFRTRLKARVVHLRSGRSSVALVACDLLSGSAIVHHALAREISDTDVPISGLLLAATHTHAGPGQFSGSEFYNRWASNRGGFDPDYTGFLVAQLSTAVHGAVANRVPAKLAFGTTDVWGYTRNRSLGAHVNNSNIDDKRLEAQRKYAAIDPVLRMIRVDDSDGPLAAFSWFSCHGTGISHHDHSYNADVWAYLNGELADRVQEATGRRPISGSVVAAHGDMTPAVRPGMLVFPEAERVGRGIGAAAADLHARLADSLSDDIEIAAGLREIDLSVDPVVDGITLPPPAIGLPKAAGATENTTFLLGKLPAFRPGSKNLHTNGPHGPKLVVPGEWLRDRLVAPVDTFPQVIPVQLLRIGRAAVIGLPFEVTVEAGRRIAAAVGDGAFVSSLANDHCDYLTTAEEYAAQHYEGASTLFGAQQQAFIAGCVRDLAASLSASDTVQEVQPRKFDFSVHRYLATPDGRPARRAIGATRFADATPTEDAYWELEWTDVCPGDLVWHKPLVAVESEDGRPVATDDGWRIGVTYEGMSRNAHRYRTRWYGPLLGRPGRYRFVLRANGGQPETRSALFS